MRKRADKLADAGVELDGDGDELAEDWAESEVQDENTLLWAYYHATDCTQREAIERVIDNPDERPTQSQASRVIRSVDDEILQRDLPLSETHLSGSWYTKQDDVDALPEPQREVIKDTIARLLITTDAVEDLFWPESDVDEDDVPEWMVPGDTDPLEIKADQYWAHGGFDESNLPPDVRRQVQPTVADD